MPAVALAGMTPALVFPVLGRIAAQQHVGTAAVTWVLTSAFLASAVSTPIVGRFADLFGRQRLLLVTVTLVLAGSVIAATTLSFPVLIAGRVLQGSASALYPLVASILQGKLAGRQMTRAIAAVSGTMGVGGGVGLAAGGLLGNGSDYRTIFWFPVAISVVALVAGRAGVPADRMKLHGSVDLLGCGLLSAGLVLVLVWLSQGVRWGFASPLSLGCIGVGSAVLIAFYLVEKRASHPMVPLRLLHHRPVLVTNVISILIGGVSFVPLVVLPILVQAQPSIVGDGSPASPLVTALVYLLPANTLGIVGTPIGSHAIRRWGPRVAVTVVGVIALAGSTAFVVAPTMPAILMVGMLFASAATFANYGTLPLLIVPQVGRADLGVANGMNSLGRWIGSALVTVLSSVLLQAGPAGQPLSQADFRRAFLIGVVASVCVILVAQFGLPSTWRSDSSDMADSLAGAPSAPIPGAEPLVIPTENPGRGG